MSKIEFINSGDNEQEDFLPVVPFVVYKELCKNFNVDSILGMSTLKNNDERIGYMRGVRDVLNRVYVLTHAKE